MVSWSYKDALRGSDGCTNHRLRQLYHWSVVLATRSHMLIARLRGQVLCLPGWRLGFAFDLPDFASALDYVSRQKAARSALSIEPHLCWSNYR